MDSRPTRRQPGRRPVPWVITFHLAFLPDDLSPKQWERAVRKLVRAHMPSLREQMDTPAFIELYDDRVSDIIEEEMASN